MSEALAQTVGALLGVLGAAAVIVLMAIVVTTVLGADIRPGGEGSDLRMGSGVTPGGSYQEEKPGL